MVILSQFLQMEKLRQKEVKRLAEDTWQGDSRVPGSLMLTFHALSSTLTYRCFSVTHSTTELPSLSARFPPLLPNSLAATEEPFVHCAVWWESRLEENRISFPHLFAGAQCTLGR